MLKTGNACNRHMHGFLPQKNYLYDSCLEAYKVAPAAVLHALFTCLILAESFSCGTIVKGSIATLGGFDWSHAC